MIRMKIHDKPPEGMLDVKDYPGWKWVHLKNVITGSETWQAIPSSSTVTEVIHKFECAFEYLRIADMHWYDNRMGEFERE